MHLWLFLLLAMAQPTPSSFPQAEISNGRIKARVHLPDAKRGYYRGTRFDWSGAVTSLEWRGHEYFGQWFEDYDPQTHDAIHGPVEEFLTGDSSLGYAEAAVGETFVRIGVGAVRKPQEQAYRRFETYEIVDHGTWKVEPGTDTITFVHTLGDTNGYAYEYRKTLRLVDDTLVIDHALKNTGRKPIATSVYNHNFFTLDRETTGPGFVVRFPFDPSAKRPLGELAELRGRELVYLKVLEPKQTVFSEIEGFGATAADYDFRVENRKTGAAVRIVGDRPIQKIIYWSAPKTLCPEPYIDASAEPGQQSTWKTTYTFYEAK
jgi:hypothetical protein